jgi:uncharacterized protein YukE
MEVLLTILSGIEVLLFLSVLLWALSRIRQTLQNIRHSMTRISWGLNAIDSETAPLPEQGRALVATADRLAGTLETIGSHLAAAEGRLAQLAGRWRG